MLLFYLYFNLYAFEWLFKEAEISASTISGATRSLDTAQKKGSTILNLKCVDVQVIELRFVYFICFLRQLIKLCWMPSLVRVNGEDSS